MSNNGYFVYRSGDRLNTVPDMIKLLEIENSDVAVEVKQQLFSFKVQRRSEIIESYSIDIRMRPSNFVLDLEWRAVPKYLPLANFIDLLLIIYCKKHDLMKEAISGCKGVFTMNSQRKGVLAVFENPLKLNDLASCLDKYVMPSVYMSFKPKGENNNSFVKVKIILNGMSSQIIENPKDMFCEKVIYLHLNQYISVLQTPIKKLTKVHVSLEITSPQTSSNTMIDLVNHLEPFKPNRPNETMNIESPATHAVVKASVSVFFDYQKQTAFVIGIKLVDLNSKWIKKHCCIDKVFDCELE